MYFSETRPLFKWSFLVITNKFAGTCSNMFGDSVIQSLKSGKTRKSGFVAMSRKKKPAVLFPARLETWPKAFHLYFLIKSSRNEAFRHFLVKYIKRLPWKHDRYKNFNFSVFPSSMNVQSFIIIRWQERKLSMIKIFKCFVSDHLKEYGQDQIIRSKSSRSLLHRDVMWEVAFGMEPVKVSHKWEYQEGITKKIEKEKAKQPRLAGFWPKSWGRK